MKRGILQRAAAAPHVVWSALFIIAPLIFVLYYTFTGQDGSFTLDNITRLGTGNYRMIFVNSLCMALIATVGRGMVRSRGVAARLCTSLSEAGVNIRMLDQGSSEMNIIVGVESEDFEPAIRAIYNCFKEDVPKQS